LSCLADDIVLLVNIWPLTRVGPELFCLFVNSLKLTMRPTVARADGMPGRKIILHRFFLSTD